MVMTFRYGIKGTIHEKKINSWTSLKLKMSALQRHCEETERKKKSHRLVENIWKTYICERTVVQNVQKAFKIQQ